jgi:hypothetical protein
LNPYGRENWHPELPLLLRIPETNYGSCRKSPLAGWPQPRIERWTNVRVKVSQTRKVPIVIWGSANGASQVTVLGFAEVWGL